MSKYFATPSWNLGRFHRLRGIFFEKLTISELIYPAKGKGKNDSCSMSTTERVTLTNLVAENTFKE